MLLSSLAERLAPADARKIATYRRDPVAFVHDCFVWRPGERPTEYQDETLADVMQYGRVATYGPHALGKTSAETWLILWFALTRDGDDWKIVTTAGVWRQLKRYLWPELRKWVRRLRWEKLGRAPFVRGRELLDLALQLSTGEAFAVASDDPSLIEGAHADHLLYVFDEAKAIGAGTWDAAEGAFMGAAGTETLALACSTPGDTTGRFYEICKNQPGFEDWHVNHVTLERVIAAGRIDPQRVEQRRRQWGDGSAVFQNRIRGQFATQDEDAVVPLAWLEAANERWLAWQEAGRPDEEAVYAIGVDVAREGRDKTVLAPVARVVQPKPARFGEPEPEPAPCKVVVTGLERYTKADTMETAGNVKILLQRYPKARAIVDVIGVGGGVVDRLREQKMAVVPFNAGAASDRTDRSGVIGFVNKRTAAWWSLRELLDPANDEAVALPPDPNLTGDLTAPRYKPTSGGKYRLEEKEDTKQRLGRSPDDGDAVVMALSGEDDGTALPFGWLTGTAV